MRILWTYEVCCTLICVRLCVCVYVWVSVSVCLWKWQWGGGGGEGIWWPEQFSSMPGVSKSNTFRTCVQWKQKIFKMLTTRHDATHTDFLIFFKQQSCTYQAGTSVSHACCRILCFCLACLLQTSALLSRVPTAEFCACLACLLQNSAQAQQVYSELPVGTFFQG